MDALQPQFNSVGVPPEDPGKSDCGGLGVMVFDPIAHDTSSSEELRAALGAEHVTIMDDLATLPLLVGRSPPSPCMTDNGEPRTHHQVDLSILKTLPLWDSLLFHHSFGDFASY